MSSHREAPEISKDPVADSTDLYAFVSPDNPDTVTIIANYIPLESPDGGPNFYEFGTDVLYAINIDNDGRRQGRHQLSVPVPARWPRSRHVPLQHGAHLVAHRPELEPAADLHGDQGPRRPGDDRAGGGLPCPPCNIGPLSTPNYEAVWPPTPSPR